MEAATDRFLFRHPLNPQMMILRGIISVGFGVLALLWPAPGLLAIAVLFGIYALANGVTTIASGIRRGREGQSWGVLVAEGVLGIAAAAVAFFAPALTLFALSIFVGVWALAIGVLELVGAFQLQKVAPSLTAPGRIIMAIVGLLSVALGGAIFMYPGLGTVSLLTLVASYAIVAGFFMIALGFRFNRARGTIDEIREEERDISKAA